MNAPPLPTPPTLSYAVDSFEIESSYGGVILRMPADPLWQQIVVWVFLFCAWVVSLIWLVLVTTSYFGTDLDRQFFFRSIGGVLAAVSLAPYLFVEGKKLLERIRGDVKSDTLFLAFADSTPTHNTDPVVEVRAIKGSLLISLRRETKLMVRTKSGRKHELFRNLPFPNSNSAPHACGKRCTYRRRPASSSAEAKHRHIESDFPSRDSSLRSE